MKILKYLKIWWMMMRNSFSVVLSQRVALLFFLIGKVVRFIFFFGFLYFLLIGTKTLAGYSSNEIIFFFLSFNLVDILAQFLFRGVYSFRPKIVSGDFDLVLVRPINPLFMSLMEGADIIDLITIPPIVYFVWYYGSLLSPTFVNVIFYILLIGNGLIIATAFHIMVLGFGIITTEIDHMIMIYRDLTSLGRFPIDIYKQPLQGFLTYLIPIGIMITIPVKALIGLVTPVGVFASIAFGAVLLFLSLRFWNCALTKYTSASS